MPQSLSATYVHLTFSTKKRLPFLQNQETRLALHSYLGGISKHLDCAPIIIGGIADHVHILARLNRTITQAAWVKELKRISTLWLKEQNHNLSDFAWQQGYAIFSVSKSNLEQVSKYIQNQEQHHRGMDFQDELRKFLLAHNIKWDEQYLWD